MENEMELELANVKIEEAIRILYYCYDNQGMANPDIYPEWTWTKEIEEIHEKWTESRILSSEQVDFLHNINIDTLDENINRHTQYMREMDRD